MNLQSVTLVMITEEDLALLKNTQQEILQQLKELHSKGPRGVSVKNIAAKEFMAAVRIGRTKFDQLVSTSKIRIIKKRRKIYVPVSEVDRYFTDPGIQ
jgi:hypothetical protein